MAGINTQGSELYFIDPDNGDVVKVGCVNSISGLTAGRDQIETTCLEDLARTYEAGMATPGAGSFSIKSDPGDTSHIRLHQLYVEGTNLDWALGWSDGRGIAPTSDSTAFELPNTRTWLDFNGYIADFPFDFAQNSKVESALSLQLSGFPNWTAKSA